ncbi:hypothetical protein [Sporichthya sp.]|uniref:hypothetical protein n=1 Tax=Sporichthya sp. TaxID=65475 RepID=UPI0017B2873C|nr:hypothetical protein [Sporichthya sp.]MBA3742492.1 hypothetical protein [Sporichthya sp.]
MLPDKVRPRSAGGPTGVEDELPAGAIVMPTITRAWAMASPPCTGRRFWIAVVTRCPHCTRLHIHRSGPALLFTDAAERRCPVTSSRYVLVPAVLDEGGS